MTNEKKLKLGLSIALAICLAGIGWVLYTFYQEIRHGDETIEMTEYSAQWTAEEAISKALSSYKEGIQPAAVTDHVSGQYVALVFDGMPLSENVEDLLHILTDHHASATFFVEGQNAADDQETVKKIKEADFGIENYTFYGTAQAETLPAEELITQLCRTESILKDVTGTAPSYVRAPDTTYTDSFLRAAKASGISSAVKENVEVNLEEVHSQADADRLIQPVKAGNIVAITMGHLVVSAAPRSEAANRDDVAQDRKPTVKDPSTRPERKVSAEPTWMEKVEYVMTALEKKGYAIGKL